MYRTKYRPEHHRADITGHVGVHILVMEEKLERPMVKGEVIHHKDFNKLNNEPCNLLLLTRKEHQQLPAFQAQFIIGQRLYELFEKWWRENKDKENTTRELEKALAIKEERFQRKMRRTKPPCLHTST